MSRGQRRGSSGSRRARLVYVSGSDGAATRAAPCSRCGTTPCRCATVDALPPDKQRVQVQRERSGRRGKTVTVAAPLFLSRERAAELLRDLKRRCGGGGTLKPDAAADGRPCHRLEVQGDHVAAVVDRLRELGFDARGAGS